MAATAQFVEEQSILLSTPELGVLCGLLGLTADIGAEGISELTRDAGDRVAVEALRTLAARGLVVHVDGTPGVQTPVARLVEVVCRPTIRVELFVRDLPDARRARHHYVRALPDAGVELREEGAGYRCTPFAAQDLIVRVAELAGLHGDLAGTGDAVTVAWGDFVAARAAAVGGDHAGVRAALAGAAAPARAVDDLAGALAGPHRVAAAQLRGRVSPARTEGAEVAWLQSGDRLWRLPTIDAPFARRRVRPVDIGDLAVTITPIDAPTLIRAMGSSLPVDLCNN